MLRRLALTIVLILSLGPMLLVGPASAGGPTSVLVTSPANERATALYYTDARYGTLEDLLHGTNTTRQTSAQEPDGDGSYFTVTWLAHDISVWRTDQLVLDVPGSPWIGTQMTYGQGVAEQGVKWRSLRDGDAISDVISSLGLTGQGSPGNAAETAPDLVAAPTTSPADEGAPGWVWIAPGVLLGVALSAAFVQTRRSASIAVSAQPQA